MRAVEKFTQKDAINSITIIREAEASAKTARETAAAMPDEKVKQQLLTLARKYDVDAEKTAEGLFRRLAQRLVGEDRSKLLSVVQANIGVFPPADSK